MTDPTPAAMEKARELATAWYHGCGFPCDGNDLPALEAAIARAIDEVRKVPPGYVREGVTDRRVLGTLPLTADGCVATVNGTFYTPGDAEEEPGLAVWAEGTSPVGSRTGFRVSYIGSERTWMSDQCYSTRAAAEAAKKGGE